MKFETPRIVIREFTPADAGFIYTLMNTQGWLEFIGDRNIHSIEDAANYIQTNLSPCYQTLGFGFWCVVDKQSDKPVGMNGLIKRDNLEHVDLGFAFLPEVNRHGFAYESSLPIIDFAKDSLKLSKLIAITDEHNLASQGLLEKLEFTRVGVVTVKEEWGESLLYEKHLNT